MAARLGALLWASNQQEDPAAKEFWGDFASDNPKLDLLILGEEHPKAFGQHCAWPT